MHDFFPKERAPQRHQQFLGYMHQHGYDKETKFCMVLKLDDSKNKFTGSRHAPALTKYFCDVLTRLFVSVMSAISVGLLPRRFHHSS